MNAKYIAIAAVVAVAAIGGIAGALVLGIGPAPGGDDGGAVGESDETATPYEDTVVVESTESGGDSGGGGDGGDGGDTVTATEQQEPFAFVIENITKCGDTCRVVNGSIVNQQDTTAEDVTVRSEIYTGGDKIWEGTSEAGSLEPGETFTDSKRVELSYAEAYKVQQNDGEILVKTYVETADGTYVFKEERNVS